jgi:hypothetical protein
LSTPKSKSVLLRGRRRSLSDALRATTLRSAKCAEVENFETKMNLRVNGELSVAFFKEAAAWGWNWVFPPPRRGHRLRICQAGWGKGRRELRR